LQVSNEKRQNLKKAKHQKKKNKKEKKWNNKKKNSIHWTLKCVPKSRFSANCWCNSCVRR
jgi:hypothetical protein